MGETSQPGALGKSLSCGPFKRQAALNKHTHKPCPVPCGEKWMLCQEKDSPEEYHKARKDRPHHFFPFPDWASFFLHLTEPGSEQSKNHRV